MAKESRTRPIQYADKSAGQPEMDLPVRTLKKMLSVYARGYLVVKEDRPGCYSKSLRLGFDFYASREWK